MISMKKYGISISRYTVFYRSVLKHACLYGSFLIYQYLFQSGLRYLVRASR